MKSRLILLIAAIALSSCGRNPKQQGAIGSAQDTARDSIYALPAVQLVAVDNLHLRAWFLELLRPLGRMRDSAYNVARLEANPQKADTLLALFRARYSKKIAAIDDSLMDQDAFQTWVQTNPIAHAFVDSTLFPLGCAAIESEGNLFIDANSKDITRNVGDRLSPAMVSFLTIRAHEEVAGFSEDAGLLIPWDSLADRIDQWETFIASHPGFILLPEAEYWYATYLGTYLTGMDNSRVFVDDMDTLDPEVHASYLRYLEKRPNSTSAGIVRGYIHILERDNFRHTNAADQYLAANHVKSMLGVQPPSR